jgi:hypothetical protein
LLASACPAQAVTLMAGDPAGAVDVKIVEPWLGSGSQTTLLSQVLLRSVNMTARTANEAGELDRVRVVPAHGRERIEFPDGARLYVYERSSPTRHGLLFVPPSGRARIVLEGAEQLDLPLAVASDARHLAFARGTELTLVRLDSSNFPGTASAVRTLTVGQSVIAASLVVGSSHCFFITDDDRVHRLALTATAMPEDVTPVGNSSPRQSEALAISGDGSTVAFLRGQLTDRYAAWVVGSSGPARRMPLPEREYREPEYLPTGNGQPHLLLNHSGSRLMVTEIDIEDELHFVDTAAGGTAAWMTGDASFAEYIGTHILPSFAGNRLLFASGHQGWMDWYAMQPDGAIVNVSMTGSPEPQFLLGALDVQKRFTLAGGTALATESFGAVERLRRLDPAGGTAVLFSDLVQPPQVGAAIGGAPDLRIVGAGGERILDGVHGQLALMVPPGISLTDPVRGPQGWRATYAHLAVGIGVPVLLLADGTPLLGTPALGMAQLAWTAAGELVVCWPDRLEVYGSQGVRILPHSAAVATAVISGAGG